MFSLKPIIPRYNPVSTEEPEKVIGVEALLNPLMIIPLFALILY
jgi:hypothetical protein